MKTTDADFIEEKNKEANAPITLFTVHDYDGQGGNIRLAEYDEDVTFDGLVYQKFKITYDSVGENISGAIDVVRVIAGNVSRYIQGLFENPDYKFRGKKVTIKTVWADHLDDPDCYVDDIYYIDTHNTDENNAYFLLSTKFDIQKVMLPGEIFLRGHCRYASKDDGFKGPRCGYTGEETECNRTWQRCKELGNQKRFGGFPSIPANIRTAFV